MKCSGRGVSRVESLSWSSEVSWKMEMRDEPMALAYSCYFIAI